MTWRKWIVRGLVSTVLTAVVGAFWLYQFWTSPEVVRAKVAAKLAERFPGAAVRVDAAHLRLFGGIAVTDVRMARRDDLDKLDFLFVPSAIIYHDKEQLLDGVLAIRKVEMHQPCLRIVRERDGRVNLGDIAAPCTDPSLPMPPIVVQQGTILFEDRLTAPNAPLIEIKDVQLTVLNDPPTIITVEGTGRIDVLGPVRLSARVRRDTGDTTAELALSAIPIGQTVVQRLTAICPELATQLRQLQGTGRIQATLTRRPGAACPVTFDATCQLKNASFNHARLMTPLEGIDAELRITNTPMPAAPAGTSSSVRITTAKLTAHSGAMLLSASLKDLRIPFTTAGPDDAPSIDDYVNEMTWKVEHVPVSKELFDKMPTTMGVFRDDYRPNGPATVTHTFEPLPGGGWVKTYMVEPEGMTATYRLFRYPVDNVRGKIEYRTTHDHRMDCSFDLTCTTSDRPITVRGKLHGEGDGPCSVDCDIRGDNIPLDGRLLQALPDETRVAATQFHPEGLGDFRIKVYRARGATRFANRFVVSVHDAAICYDLFPLRFDIQSGVLDVLPDHWEVRDIHGTHDGGEIRFSGQSFPDKPGAPATPRMKLEIHGNKLRLDRDFEVALSPPDMPQRAALLRAWRTLMLSGRLSFDAQVLDLGAPADLDINVAARGCTIRPQFFDLPLEVVRSAVHYTKDRVTIHDVETRHGPALLRLHEGYVLPKPNGGFQTRLGAPARQGQGIEPGTGLEIVGLAPDTEVLDALPPGLRKGLDALQVRGPLDVTAEMVIDQQEDSNNEIWWNGTMTMHNTALRTGVDLTGVNGQAWCCGLYRKQKLSTLLGRVMCQDAAVFGQPLHNLHVRFEVQPERPDWLGFRDLGAELFGGQVGGEAHIDFSTVPRFEVNLEALQVKLEQFGRFNRLGPGAEVEGSVGAKLFLKGEVGDLSTMSGDGQFDVPKGKLYRLPPLLDLLKAIGLRAPDHTAFERARVVFSVEGQRVKVSELDLFGSAVSLRGHGEMNIDGTDLFLDFHADPGMVTQVLPPLLTEIPKEVSNQLLTIKVRGQLTDPKFEKELVPGVTEPVRKWLGTKW
jgi:hypothetical protein